MALSMRPGDWLWTLLAWGTALGVLAAYTVARRRTAVADASLGHGARWLALAIALAGWAAALSFPLAPLSRVDVLARMTQTVIVCMVAAPLFWLAAPWHLFAWAAPHRLRTRLSRAAVRPRRYTPLVQTLTSPAVVWFVYLSAVLIWHDPLFVEWEMAAPWRQRAALLILGVAALLFWQQITRCGPRRYTRGTPLARIVMLLGVEVANVVAGISIAFRTTPLYTYFANLPGAPTDFGPFSPQTLSGALTWIFGTLVYISSIVLVANELFKREGMNAAQHLPGWDHDERFIAPGLEGRLRDPDRDPHDWRNTR